jgi:hypothetical protein
LSERKQEATPGVPRWCGCSGGDAVVTPDLIVVWDQTRGKLMSMESIPTITISRAPNINLVQQFPLVRRTCWSSLRRRLVLE